LERAGNGRKKTDAGPRGGLKPDVQGKGEKKAPVVGSKRGKEDQKHALSQRPETASQGKNEGEFQINARGRTR